MNTGTADAYCLNVAAAEEKEEAAAAALEEGDRGGRSEALTGTAGKHGDNRDVVFTEVLLIRTLSYDS